MKYVVSHNDERGVWGKVSSNPIVPLSNLREAIKATRAMTGHLHSYISQIVIYRLEPVGHKMKRPITRTQNKYIQYVKKFYKYHRYQPTIRQIAKHFNRGISTVYMTMQKAGINYAFYRKLKI